MAIRQQKTEWLKANLGIAILTICVFLLGLVMSFFRDAQADEVYYLHEVMVMADCLKHLQWFGNEAVGLHGFLFKLPAAFLMMLFRNSVFVATLVTVLLAALSCWLCFKLMRLLLGSQIWALMGTWLVVTNYQFILTTPTFLREIPLIFSFLLFLYVISRRKNKWIVGLALSLVFDAKEYVFFMILPGFLLWIFWEEIHRKGSTFRKSLRKIFWRIIAGLFPSGIYLVLMFCSGIVPINMFNAYILGMVERGLQNVVYAFRVQKATANLWEGGKSISQIPYFPPALNIPLKYFGKLLYPRTFSFISIPKIIVLPAIVMSVKMFKRFKVNTARIILPLILWGYLIVFILRASHGRYLLPVAPIFVFFFIQFLKNGFETPRFTRNVLLGTTLFVILGLWFEPTYRLIKVGLNAILLGSFWVAFWLNQKEHKRARPFTFSLSGFVGVTTLAVALSAFFLLQGAQLNNYLVWGYNHQCDMIVSYFKPGERIWTNYSTGFKITFFNRERDLTPEWNWKLKDWVPKKRLLHRYEDRHIFDFDWVDLKDFQESIKNKGIHRIAFIVSTYPNRKFPRQDYLADLKQSEWLVLTEEIPLKNKILYVFEVGA